MIHSIVTYQRERDETKPAHDYIPRGRGSTTSSGTAPLEDKPLLEYLSILQRSDCGEAGATGEKQMKTIAIRLPDVEAAMLVEVQKVNKAYRDLQGFMMSQIQTEYQKTPKARVSK